ncbi:MAG TPA: Gfo/Idh/MocA family oxidoreductase [Planctomycetaceae bacterium]|nr:Gfo/Idh/MocA family oxidoreductase [Planctomycetaceae bacterium]
MSQQPVRVGIVGAGANTRLRHIPGLRAVPQVEIVGVVNSTPASTERVSREFGIRKTYTDWRALVDDPEIDAVVVGTWPNLHSDVTCAALTAGKHVLTEARMARNLVEARRMVSVARAHSHLVAQIVPSPFGLEEDAVMRKLITERYLGDLREAVVIGADDTFWDYSRPLHWRQDRELSGFNVLSMGILHETLMRWTPPVTRVFAQAQTFEPRRPVPAQLREGQVTVPDSVQIVTQLEGGARGIYHISGVLLFGPGKQIHLYGTHGTIKLEIAPEARLWCGRAGDTELRELEIPNDMRGGWRVEEEFIGAIRGTEKVRFTDFETGLKYMEFTEAVHRSAESNQPVDLPIE